MTVVADAAVLVGLRPGPTRLATRLAHPGRWIDAVGADAAIGALAGATLWLLAAWVAVGLLATAAGRLPGAAGATARRIAALALPGVLRRALAGAAGLGVLLSPAVASAGAPHPGGAATAVGTAVPSPLPPSDVLPAPRLPLVQRPAAPPTARELPTSGLRTHGLPAHEVRTGSARAPVRTVTVRPGDSLWQIAAARLGTRPSPARVAAAWPRWFAANRAVIGEDPDYLVPGEVLHAPEESR